MTGEDRVNDRAAPDDHSITPSPQSTLARRSSPMRALWRVLRIGLLAYLGIAVMLMFMERSLIFFPMKYPSGDWEYQPPGAEDVEFTADDGTRLHGWFATHEDPLAVILFAHGNAGNITHRTDVLQRLHHDLHCTVLLFDYRGYGKSEGRPNEDGVLRDGRAARDYLAQRAGVVNDELVLMGRSLGTAVAVDLAADGGARALVLYSAFPSMPDVAAYHYPWLPVRWLMRTRLNSVDKIQNYHGPLLQAHGEEDEIITVELGRRLFDAAPMQNKQWFTLGASSHNDPPPAAFYVALRHFLTDLPLPHHADEAPADPVR
jgi:uncharacterized protein